ncbi:hypothetical protein FHS70_000662 [Flammeovirga yaeyamensis]|nr:hypothetical protein [Flammeovirga yaeyamensis]
MNTHHRPLRLASILSLTCSLLMTIYYMGLSGGEGGGMFILTIATSIFSLFILGIESLLYNNSNASTKTTFITELIFLILILALSITFLKFRII